MLRTKIKIFALALCATLVMSSMSAMADINMLSTETRPDVVWEKEYENIDTMANEAVVVVRGRVINQSTEVAENNLVFTNNSIEITKTYKGIVLNTIIVKQIGGECDNRNTQAPLELPILNVGDQYVFFLKQNSDLNSYYIMGAGQGFFTKEAELSSQNYEEVITNCSASFYEKLQNNYSMARTVETPASGCKWKKSRVGFSIGYTTISSSYVSAVRRGVVSWNGLANITLYEGGSDICIYFSSGSSSGINAYAMPDCSGTTINYYEIILYTDASALNSTTRWQTVACHEVGHALGLSHYGAYSASVMYPYIENCSVSPQQPDILGLQSLY